MKTEGDQTDSIPHKGAIMEDYQRKIYDATLFLQKKLPLLPSTGIILGSGLGDIVEGAGRRLAVNYADIPGFPKAMVQGHKGELVCGELAGKGVIIFNGRFHFYQGYSLRDVTLPVRVARRLGVETLIITNASGGINRDFKPGDIMLIKDHINLIGGNPLIGEEAGSFGPLFVDMTEPYDSELIAKTGQIAEAMHGVGSLRQGVYLATSGPSYETKAEITFFERIGADAVGMSTVPEVIVANQEGMRVLGISVIANMACGVKEGKLSHHEVLEAMGKAAQRLIPLLKEIIKHV